MYKLGDSSEVYLLCFIIAQIFRWSNIFCFTLFSSHSDFYMGIMIRSDIFQVHFPLRFCPGKRFDWMEGEVRKTQVRSFWWQMMMTNDDDKGQ